jgi:hypothetical protein
MTAFTLLLMLGVVAVVAAVLSAIKSRAGAVAEATKPQPLRKSGLFFLGL